MEKLLIITPHLSTGGAPQFTLNKIELLKDSYDIYCVEYSFLSPHYVVQRNKISKILGDKFIPLYDDKEKLINIINDISPTIISLEEIAETFIMHNIMEFIYDEKRSYKILESTHSSNDFSNIKQFLPDKFIFVSEWSRRMYSHLGVESDVIEYPIEHKIRNKAEMQKKLGLDTSKKHIVNVGLFTPGKNQKYAFEIADNINNKDVIFHFIGNQADNFKDYWEPLLNNKPENCVIWGERDDVDDFIMASDIFLFTSKFELNPLVIKEALCYKDLPIMMFNLETYSNNYDKVDNINYLKGDLVSDIKAMLNILEISEDIKKYKLRAVHLLIDIESERESISIESMSAISNKIEYIQNINIRYTGEDWKNNIPMFGWENHGPGHYGAFTSFKSAIENHFTDDLDAFLIFEADCVLNIETEEFINLVKKAVNFCEKYNIEYFSFGERHLDGYLNSKELNDNDFREFIITNKIILAHCILFPKKSRNKLLDSLKTKKWDTPDYFFNGIFNRKGISREKVAIQYPGISMIDDKFSNLEYFSNKTREEVIPYILNLNGLKGKGVEIGVFKGKFSKHLLNNWCGELYLVDPWRGLDDYIDSSNHQNHPNAYLETINNISGYEDRAIMIRSLSKQAVDLFRDNSLDFIYIDGNHSYDSVKEDLEIWYPKLKKGGIFSGHDYIRMDWYNDPHFLENKKDKHIWSNNGSGELGYAGVFGVNPAVDEFCKENHLTLYLTSEWTATWIIFK
jgi:hypothetical protein